MTKFRFSIVVLCVILPPLLYIGTVQLLEIYGAQRVQAGLEKVYLGDVQSLLTGNKRIQDAVSDNIDRFIHDDLWVAFGAKLVVTVRTGGNTLLYPLSDVLAHNDIQTAPSDIAVANYRLLNEQPLVSVDFRLPHNALITNFILGLYICAAIGVLYFNYRKWRWQYLKEKEGQTLVQQQLAQKGQAYERQMVALKEDRGRLDQEVRQLQDKLEVTKQQAENSEQELLEEIISLEDKIAEKLLAQSQHQSDMEMLQDKIETLEKQLELEQDRKTKLSDSIQKRLRAVYKNMEITDRAVAGFVELTEEMKIKCEEVIHQLNDDTSKVPIKRKVFGKKNRVTVFEVVFGYKGRLYYRPDGKNKCTVLVIGTKNSQQQDLEHLNRL